MDDYTWSDLLAADYGIPSGTAKESAPGVFTREWSKASVTVDCNAYTSKIEFHYN
jgi:hypothetical protein